MQNLLVILSGFMALIFVGKKVYQTFRGNAPPSCHGCSNCAVSGCLATRKENDKT